MKLQLIHIDNYFLVVDDSEIKERDWFVMNGCIIRQCKSTNKEQHTIPTVVDTIEGIHHVSVCEKITHHLPLNNAPVLKGIELLPPLEDDFEKLADDYSKQFKGDYDDNCTEYAANKGFIEGYNKAKEDYKYTQEDIKMAIQQAFLSGVERLEDFEKVEKMVIENIKGLQPKLPTSFDTETKQYIYATHN